MSGLLENKTVLIIGATSGIGLAAVSHFASEGAFVIAAARREDRADAIVQSARAAGSDARFISVDIGDRGSIARLFETIARDHAKLDGAFNNAAIQPAPTLMHEVDDDLFDQMFAINVRGTFGCLRQEMNAMIATGGGSIVNTASIAGLRAFYSNGTYSATKHAIIGLTKACAIDSAQFNIRVNCVCPGATQTEMMEELIAQRPGGLEATVAGIPMKRVADLSEPAAAAAFLLSDRASFITGEAIVVDGGSTIK